jgi:hypothetical protein
MNVKKGKRQKFSFFFTDQTIFPLMAKKITKKSCMQISKDPNRIDRHYIFSDIAKQ